MKMTKTPELLGIGLTVALILATFGTGHAAAAITAGAPSSDAMARYEHERANCLDGKTTQDQKTCLKEAGAALQAAREHELGSGSPDQLAADARARCEPLSGDDRKACLARAAGQGITSGSVAGGGELHELVTVTPGSAASASQ